MPIPYDLSIYRGDTFELRARFRGTTVDGLAGDLVDMTGTTAQAQIRPSYNSSAVLGTFTCTLDDINTYLISMSSTDTTSLDAGQIGVWDFQVTFPDSTVRTYLNGTVTMSGEVTR